MTTERVGLVRVAARPRGEFLLPVFGGDALDDGGYFVDGGGYGDDEGFVSEDGVIGGEGGVGGGGGVGAFVAAALGEAGLEG